MEFQVQARALGEPTRYRIFRYLLDASDGADVPELSAVFGLHHNAIRQHLDKLVGAGLVVEDVALRGARGRPRLRFRVNPRADARWGTQSPYERLSAILADALRTGSSPSEAGRRAGARAAAEHHLGPGPDDPTMLFEQVMARGGFEPQVVERPGGADVVLHACPFAAAAMSDPDVVCAVHRGIAEGVADAAGGAVAVVGLDVVDPRTGGCRLRLRRAPNG